MTRPETWSGSEHAAEVRADADLRNSPVVTNLPVAALVLFVERCIAADGPGPAARAKIARASADEYLDVVDTRCAVAEPNLGGRDAIAGMVRSGRS